MNKREAKKIANQIGSVLINNELSHDLEDLDRYGEEGRAKVIAALRDLSQELYRRGGVQ